MSACFVKYTIFTAVICSLWCNVQRDTGLESAQNDITVNVALVFLVLHPSAVVNVAGGHGEVDYTYLLASNNVFYAERPIFPLGQGLVCRTLMLLICDLQTLCFLFSSSLSSPPLTILSPFFCWLFVFHVSLLFPNTFVFFFHLFSLILSFSPSLHPCVTVGVWEKYIFSYSQNRLYALFCITRDSSSLYR